MHDEAAAFAHVESIIWQDGPVCPHGSVVDRAYRLTGVRSKPSKKNPEGVERHGLWKCRECRKQFMVRKGTIFEERNSLKFLAGYQGGLMQCDACQCCKTVTVMARDSAVVRGNWSTAGRMCAADS